MVGFFWGTTFLGIKIGVETIPPWFVAGIRQFLAALILLPVLLYRKELKWPGWKTVKTQFTLAALLLIGANGLMTVAEQNLSSSLASLINAFSPVLIFLGSLLIGLEKFSTKSLIGILFGFMGIVFIFWDGLKDLANPDYRLGIITIFIAISSWAAGTVYAKKKHVKSDHLMLNLFYQFAFAGILQIIFAFIFSPSYHFGLWSTRSILAVLYLSIFGSVITFFAYHFLIKNLAPTKLSMLAYVNTIIAIFLGWLILNEEITVKFIFAAVCIIIGVFIMNYKPEMFNKKN